MKKLLQRILLGLLLFVVLFLVFLAAKIFPVLDAYAAKTVCSNLYVSGRSQASIDSAEFGSFPFNIPSIVINYRDSSVTVSTAGMFSRTAIYRRGLGATLISGLPEATVRKQSFMLASPPRPLNDTLEWPLGNKILFRQDRRFNGLVQDSATRAVVIVHKGRIIMEQYAKGFSPTTPQLGWSMTKSIENALLGILVQQGRLNIYQRAPITEWRKDERSTITVADLMHMSSGLRYDASPVGASDLTEMLFMQPDMPHFAVAAHQEHPTASFFHYADATANILSLVQRKILGDSDYYRFPYEELFYKIGMNSAMLEVDAAGNFVQSSYCYATPRDWARFGLLYLQDGYWNGQRILPRGWVQFTRTPAPGVNYEHHGEYGALWWINTPNKSGVKRYLDVPEDCFFCQGYEGQDVWVIPSKQLVVVRLAMERITKLDANFFLSKIIRSLDNE